MVIVDKINRSGDLATKFCRDGSLVNKAYYGAELVYQRASIENYNDKYLTIEVVSGGTIIMNIGSIQQQIKSFEYKKNDGEWTSIDYTTSVSVNSGDNLYLRGNNLDVENGSTSKTSIRTDDAIIKAKGNIMSLVNSTDFENLTAITGTFYLLFNACYGLVDASELILPAVTLSNNAYDHMFQTCTSLEKAPTLIAPTLAPYCYYHMFAGCSSLNYVKCLATDISAEKCTDSWLSMVAQNGTFEQTPGVEWPSGANGIPDGWTIK